ncbi:MAG: amino acid ABC transporter substrate-binding protein [Treponema sp. CETP13]|nr:MAG: amino acid ABC transporter substrate-binding protein [Treponema sp. CETP13]
MRKLFSRIFVVVSVLALLFTTVSCSKKDTTEEADTIKIGAIGPYTGAVAVYGLEARNGIELAIDEINANGGIMGKQVELFAEDDEGAPEKTVSVYKKLTVKDGVDIIVGSLTSGCTAAITSLAQAQKVLLFAPAATQTNITEAGNYIFRACFIDPFQGTVGGKFAAENLNKKKAAILYDVQNDYSLGLKENFTSAFEAAGGQVVATESYATGDKDFNAQITKIKQSNPDVVYLPDYYQTVALIAKQLRAQGITVAAIGADGWGGIEEHAGDEVLNGYYSNHYAADSTDPKVIEFVAAYKEKFGTTPVSFAALSYDCVYMLKDSIEAAGSADATAVRDALKDTDADYVTGHFTFDENRNPVKSAVMMQIVKDGDSLKPVYNSTVNP